MRLSEHPAFSQADPRLINDIQKALDTGTCKNGMEAVQKLMFISQQIEKNNITFTPEMQSVLLSYFKNRLPKNQRSQFTMVLNMVEQLKNNNQTPH